MDRWNNAREKDLEEFLDELDEDPEMRTHVNCTSLSDEEDDQESPTILPVVA